ncbi:2Fe-2S iron-sulfur cluster-binding protein, partial [Pseudomonas aeruginosa]
MDPNLSVLDYLRRLLGKTGSKDGCASGDCGACTVVVGDLVTGEDGAARIRYRRLHSCLPCVSAVHGEQGLTVEDLKHQAR